MKKIVFALIALAVLATACSKDFINPRHNSSEPLDEYFNTPERLFQCLVAAYDPLEWYDYAFGQYDNLHLIFDVMGDDARLNATIQKGDNAKTREEGLIEI